MTRWQAAGIHLGISAIVATLIMGVLLFVWYPSVYFTAMGGQQLVYLLVGVDVVLGPLITLIIYRHGKKGLKTDLAIIGMLQATALAYGVSIAGQARPVYTAFVVDRFEVAAANDIDQEELEKVKNPEYKVLSWTGPRLVGALKPTDPDEQFRIMSAFALGKDLQHYPQLYVPYTQVAADVAAHAQPLSTLRRLNPDRGAEIDAFLRKNQVAEPDVGFLPIKTRRAAYTVIVNKKGDILGMLETTPW